ncbi:integrase domain-containing protein [Gilliamella sp. W8145]|nr:integrase domain-containing protein [Gilliamella sp. W8145]
MIDIQYHNLHKQAPRQASALAATLDIAGTLGLRSAEAVQSCQSLKIWQRVFNNSAISIKVVFGTKVSRTQQVHIIIQQ